MSEKKRFRNRINAIVKGHHDHYLGRLWKWAERRGHHTDNHRWRALAGWAHMHEQYAANKSHHYKTLQTWLRNHHKRKYVIHRAYKRFRYQLTRARHWAHIEKLYRQENRRLKPIKKNPTPSPGGANLVTFDGRLVAGWIVRDALIPARASGVWTGVAFSGYRTPAYSTSLCIAMCGQPQCPGRCAGAASNHACPPSATCQPYEGAVDLSDSYGMQRWVAAHGYPIRHTLPYDLPHFSRTGQ